MITAYNIAAFLLLVYAAITLTVHISYNKNLSHICYTLIVLGFLDVLVEEIVRLPVMHVILAGGKPLAYWMYYLYFVLGLFYPFVLFLFYAYFSRLSRLYRVLAALPATTSAIALITGQQIVGNMFHLKNDLIYVEGVTKILNLNGIFYMILYIVLLLYHLEILGKRRSTVLLITVAVTLITYLIQAARTDLNLINLGLAICLNFSILFFFYIDDTIDHQTGLQGKDGFYREVRAILKHDHSKRQYLLMRCNIRHLKDINELYGYDVGSKLVKEVAKRLYQMTYPEGCCGRLGNNDFAYLMPSDYVNENQTAWTEEVANQLEIRAYNIDLVTGVYHIVDKTKSVDLMCDRADYAMSSIKQNYMVSYAYFTDVMEREIAEVRSIEADMYKALIENQFHVYYQPIYDLKKNEIMSAEALVRWIHPTRGLIPPDRFIKLFEKNGFVSNLDEYVLERVCKDLRRWEEEGKKLYPISVNISRVEFNDVDHMMRMNEIFIRSGVDRHLLRLEVTESDFASGNGQQMMAMLENFRKSGVKILMDDFGTGYSSLSMLHQMPLDMLKIDMRFLERGLDELDAAKGRSILRYTVQVAQSLGIPVVVEGVETEDQAEFLKSLNCECVQGFLYARPMEVQKYSALIN